MSMAMVRQTIVTPQLATAASMLVRLAHPGDGSLHRALEKAEGRVIALPWRIDGGVLCISSHSKPGQVRYCDGATCDCLTTRGVCWHVAAWHLISTLAATGIEPIADLPLPSVTNDDDLPSSFLDGDFSAFEDTSLLGHDEYGDVVAIQPAPRSRPRLEPLPPFYEVGELPAAMVRAQAAVDELFQ